MSKSYDDAVSAYEPDTRERLKPWKVRTEDGFDMVLRSQVGYDEEFDDLVAEWQSDLHKLETDPLVLSFEADEKGKMGPLSMQSPWAERKDAVVASVAARPNSIEESAWSQALGWLRGMIKPRSLSPMSVDEVLLRQPHNTNLGLPTYSRDRAFITDYIRRFNRLIAGDSEVMIEPFVLGWRGQAGGYHPAPWSKDRALRMADKLDGIAGGRFVYPILEELKRRHEFAAWNDLSVVGEAVHRILALNKDVRSTDFSGFDDSISSRIIDDIFDIIALWFTETRGLDEVRRSFKYGDLLTPDGLLTDRDGGIPSGSVFTNLVGTFINLVSARYIAILLGVRHLSGTYLGDDALNVYDPSPDDKEVEDAGSTLNLDLNAEKQYVARSSCHYLQNVYQIDRNGLKFGGGVRPTFRALNGILHYERGRRKDEWNDAMAAMRTINQLENCKYSSAHRGLTKFCAQKDRRLLERSATSLMREAGGVRKVEETLGLSAFRYTSHEVSKLSEFATVRVLAELA